MGKGLEGILRRTPNVKFSKPCHTLGFCPYGSLVEEFPLHSQESKLAKEMGYVQPNGMADLNRYIKDFGPSITSCNLFGHDCPVFYCGEDLAEQRKEQILDEVCSRVSRRTE